MLTSFSGAGWLYCFSKNFRWEKLHLLFELFPFSEGVWWQDRCHHCSYTCSWWVWPDSCLSSSSVLVACAGDLAGSSGEHTAAASLTMEMGCAGRWLWHLDNAKKGRRNLVTPIGLGFVWVFLKAAFWLSGWGSSVLNGFGATWHFHDLALSLALLGITLPNSPWNLNFSLSSLPLSLSFSNLVSMIK